MNRMRLFGNFSLRKLLYNRRFTVPFSIVLAFVLWLVITINQKPTMERTFTGVSVSVNLENTIAAENQMSIIGDISEQKFTVIVRGPSYLVSSLSSEDLNLYASAAAVDAPGDYSLKVAATSDTTNAEYEILSISPPTLNINFDYVDTKEFTINAMAEGATAAEGLIAESGIVSGTESDTLTITGPRTVINKIENVVALAQVNKTLSASESFDANIILYDAEGNVITPDNLTLSATNVKVTVPISKKKTVPVVVEFSNLPTGFSKNTLSVSVDYPTVTVIGTPETVDKTTQVSLSAIDITTVSTTSESFDVSPKLPEGVRLLDTIDHFTVNVDTAGYSEKLVTVSSIKYTGLSSGLNTDAGAVIKNVKICGPRNVINKFDASDIVAEINLADKKAGEHSVIATFKINGHDDVWVIGTYKTTVTVK